MLQVLDIDLKRFNYLSLKHQQPDTRRYINGKLKVAGGSDYESSYIFGDRLSI